MGWLINDFHTSVSRRRQYVSYLHQLKKDFHFSAGTCFKDLWISVEKKVEQKLSSFLRPFPQVFHN